MQTDIHQFLSQLGFTDKERTIYINSLKYGPQTASTIAHKTNFASSTVNFVFANLIKKGFATKEKREATTYFAVLNPELLKYDLETKEAEIKKLNSDFDSILPLLKGLQGESANKPKITYLEGLKGIYRAIDDSCAKDCTRYFISSHNNMHPEVRKYIENVYIPKSEKFKSNVEMIVNAGEHIDEYLEKSKKLRREVIIVDPKTNPFKLTTSIYDNKVAFISYDPEDLTAVIIENEFIAEHMKAVFQITKKFFKQST